MSFEIFRDSESLGIFQTDEFGQILLTNCEPGTYRAEERDTGGDGHVLDTTPQEGGVESRGRHPRSWFFQ